MTQLVTFPDAVALVVSYLNGVLTEPVSSRVPNPRPAAWVTVSRAGGTARNALVDAPLLAVDAWAASGEPEAHDLAQRARAWLHAAVGQVVDGTVVYRCDEASGPAPNPDPVSEVPRFSFAVQLAVRGTVATV